MEIEKLRNLQSDFGEVQLYMDSGATFEIHKDAVVADDYIFFEDEDSEKWYLDPEKVEYVSVHRSHRSGPA